MTLTGQKGYDLPRLKVARRCIEELTDYLTDTLCREDLESLITEEGAWKAFVETAELSSEEEAALRDALKEHLARAPTDEDDVNDGPQKELKKKRFLEEFPQLKSKLEGHIKKLHALADHLDKVHSDCTVSSVVADSTSTVSGVLGILGLVLTPITGGTSLMLSAAALGLVAGMTSVTTTIVEESNRSSDEAEASRLVGASMDILHEIMKTMPKIRVKLANTGLDLISACKTLKEQISTIRMARASSRLGAQATESISDEASKKVGKSLGGTIRGIGFTSVFLSLDVYHLVTDSMELYEGAKTESAGALRKLAQMLDRKLQGFEQMHKALQSDLPQ
ncbi:apolipoprotein L3-like [Peromyscus californicus insignis]|uniref:apolipoprotein L3-like n=1 Tax=Peromyscus californicus insignis TaxID=564181 RepID=UPI0022A7C39F|nr:apolipoprotein L3-like [Peromyscus californicus insignis]